MTLYTSLATTCYHARFKKRLAVWIQVQIKARWVCLSVVWIQNSVKILSFMRIYGGEGL